MCKSISITVCTVHVHRMPYAVFVCANTFTCSVGAKYVRTVHNIQTLSVNQWEGNAGKMENTNTQIRELVVFELMHATKVSCNVVVFWKYQYAN